MAPDAKEVSAQTYDEIHFVDCGGKFQAIHGPSYDAEVAVPWWQEAMDRAHRFGFTDLTVVVPCCGAATSLNDLRYDRPMGLARWELIAFGPRRMQLTDTEVLELEQAVGRRLRQVWTHY